MLRGCRCLSGHLKLSNLAFGQATVVVTIVLVGVRVRVGTLLLGLRFGLRGLLGRLVQGIGGFGVLASEVDTGGRWRNLALGLEET